MFYVGLELITERCWYWASPVDFVNIVAALPVIWRHNHVWSKLWSEAAGACNQFY